MGSLIAVVGPSGVGKTSLVRALGAAMPFACGLEDHAGRPFQELFKQDRRYAFANQIDYLLYRAEQERDLRAQQLPALVDGGLDQDFHGFTRLFHAKGWLGPEEYETCSRFYSFARSLLPPPDLVIALEVAPQVIRSRLAARQRINVATDEDSGRLKAFLDEWLKSRPLHEVIRLDVSDESMDYTQATRIVIERLAAQPHNKS
jgi:deoxyadenosine/deoxycytidine kinase